MWTKSERQPRREPNVVYICFLAKINDQSIEKLIEIVNEQQHKGSKKFVILMHSTGGDVDPAVTGYNFLTGFKDLEIVTNNIGAVQSAAVVLYCAGRVRLSAPYAYFFIHDVFKEITGPDFIREAELEERYTDILNHRRQVATILAKATGRRIEQVEKAMKEVTPIDAEDAVSWGLVHEIRDKFMDIGQEVIFIEEPKEVQ